MRSITANRLLTSRYMSASTIPIRNMRGDVTTGPLGVFILNLQAWNDWDLSALRRTTLAALLDEFDFRYSNRAALGVDDTERTRRAIAKAATASG